MRGCVVRELGMGKRGKAYLDVDLVLLVRIHHRGDGVTILSKKWVVMPAQETKFSFSFVVKKRAIIQRRSKLWASARRKWVQRLGKVWRIRLLKLGGTHARGQEPRRVVGR